MNNTKQVGALFLRFRHPTFNGMKMSSLRVICCDLHVAFDQRGAGGGLSGAPRPFTRFVLPIAPGSSPPCPGSSIRQWAVAPRFTGLRARFAAAAPVYPDRLYCSLPAAPAADPAYPAHWQDKDPSPDVLKAFQATGASANSCGFTFCFSSKTIRTVLGSNCPTLRI